LRPIKITPNIIKNADGSVLYESGNTEVICTATFESKVPEWLQDSGWITAEYSMLPASTNSRVTREITRGKKNARSQEIQRLIGRALRGSANLEKMPGISIYVDCDVINADGGTRTASINGGYLAIALALKSKYPDLYNQGILTPVSAISVGKVDGKIVDDLDYIQDSAAEVDLNIVMNSDFNLIEIQGTGEKGTFSNEELNQMLDLGKKCIKNIFDEQIKVLKS
jgi:ribonuclease PH